MNSSTSNTGRDRDSILSGILIAGAFSIIVSVLWGGVGLFDNVNEFGKRWVLVAGVLGTVLLAISILCGGLGIAYGTKSGNWNHFDWQAKLGIVALIALLSVPIVAYINWLDADTELRQELNDLRKAVLEIQRQELIDFRKIMAEGQTKLDNRLDILDRKIDLNADETSGLRQDIGSLKKEIDLLQLRSPERENQDQQ